MLYLLDKSNTPYFETSAKEGINVEKAFESVARSALEREEDVDQTMDFPSSFTIPKSRQPTQSSGCSC